MAVTIIADDLSGACDAGALFAGRGPVGVFVAPELPDARWPAAAVDTESRALPPAAAAERVRRAADGLEARLGGGRIFKKLDSTVRGPVAAELDALMGASGARTALVCPAFPAQGRTVRDGVLSVFGQPAHEGPAGRDPDYPGPTSDLVEILSSPWGRPVSLLPLPVSLLPLKEVRGPLEELARALVMRTGLVVADAEVDQDLDALARAAMDLPGVLLAGSAGLAGAAARAWGFAAPAPPTPAPGSWLVVAGSRHPATRAQVDALEASGSAGARLDGAREPDLAKVVAALRAGKPAFLSTTAGLEGAAQDIAARLASAVKRVLAEASPALLVLTGGETAQAVMRALAARRLELIGAPASGLALGRLVVDSTSMIPILTKAGGFGTPELLVALARGPA
ncbi:MAG: four-carbon acid sugar kinase family protein [Candidatus Rokubacteria bacterium]|nr:four-carbon acid sugar kinase family protein [Candidatus Rokubacteria bacterium]